MAALYADEHFPVQVVFRLRKVGHRVTTVRSTSRSKSGDGMSDRDVLSYATLHGMAVLTENRCDFLKLHREYPGHRGIITSKVYADWKQQAKEIDAAIRDAERIHGHLDGLLISIPYEINDPSRPIPLKKGG